LASVKTAAGPEALRLLPSGETVEVAPWQGGELRVAAPRVAKLSNGLVSLSADRITVWAGEPKQIEASDIDTLVAPPGEARFVLAVGAKKAFVVDSQDANTRLESASEGAMLGRGEKGPTRLGRLTDKRKYEIVELTDGKQVEIWQDLVAHDATRGLVAVSRTDVDAQYKAFVEIAIMRVSDGAVQAKSRLPIETAVKLIGKARISPDTKSLAYATITEAYHVHLDSGRADLLMRARKDWLIQSAVFTADGAHVCVDAPGPAFPRSKPVPSATQRCYVSNGVAHVAHLMPPPAGFRRAQREDFIAADFGFQEDYEVINDNGSLVAAILYDGKPLPFVPQRFTLAVYDAKTGKQLWNQFLDGMQSLTPVSLEFTADGETLLVDGVRVRVGISKRESDVVAGADPRRQAIDHAYPRGSRRYVAARLGEEHGERCLPHQRRR